MRYVPTFCIREGMVLGKSLYGSNNELMLRDGTELTANYIRLITKLQYNGLYVQDSLSENIEIANMIDENVKNEAIKGIKKIFMSPGKDTKNFENRVKEINAIVTDIIEGILKNKDLMLNMIDLKVFDDYTFYHSTNVAILSLLIGVTLNLPKHTLYELCLSAFLHDIGKVFIPKEVLNKEGKLTDKEYDVMKGHTELGSKYVMKAFSIPERVCDGIIDHHEKFDGTGYPNKKKGHKISLFGRIIAVADVYDALTSDRVYRKGLPPSEAMEFIMGGAGLQFDPEIVQIFVKKVAPYPLGTCVELSNGMIGIVIANYEDCCLRPSVKVFQHNGVDVTPFVMNLKSDLQYTNVTILKIAEI
jgi:HD-GYP domain